MKIPVIMGPTASGKSAIALAAAGRFDGEIVSIDSMQLYRGLDKGTAKPSAEERARIPHHMIDVLEIDQRSDLFSFKDAAEKCIDEIRKRGKLPVAAGGTGLYLRALLYGLDEMPSDTGLRKRLDDEFDSESGFEKLKKLSAEKIPDDFSRWSSDRRRLIRAYEVFLLSGQSITSRQKIWKQQRPRTDAVQFLLEWDREELKERIRRRCHEMLDNGWIDEVRELMKKKDLFRSPTAWQVLGYAAVRDYINGKLSRTELEEAITVSTRQYARRQRVWFHGQHPEAIRIPMPMPMEKILNIIEENISSPVF